MSDPVADVDNILADRPPADPPKAVDDAPAAPPTCGRMIIDLLDNGTARPIPRVSFDPVGRFTAGMMMDYVSHFAREIDRAQAGVRHQQEREKMQTLAMVPHPSPKRRR